MIWYADASFLVSAFGKDAHSRKAARWLGRGVDFPILISRLTILETEIAWRAALKYQRLSEGDCAAARRQLNPSSPSTKDSSWSLELSLICSGFSME